VFIHGISFPALIFKNVANALVKEGCRVLLYDVYGRGYSEGADGPQDPNLYILQLALLMQYVRWDSADIIGFSMGGAITAAFTSMFPHLIKENVVFVSAAGMMEKPGDTSSSAAPAPELNPESAEKAAEASAKIRELQWELLPGAKRAVMDTGADGVIRGLHWAYDTIGKTSRKRFLIVHGTADKVVPFTEAQKIKKLIPQAKLVPLEGISHYVPLEEGAWQKFVDELLPFLRGTEGRLSKY